MADDGANATSSKVSTPEHERYSPHLFVLDCMSVLSRQGLHPRWHGADARAVIENVTELLELLGIEPVSESERDTCPRCGVTADDPLANLCSYWSAR